MSTKTITLAGSEVKAEFSGANAWLRNDGADVIYAAAKPGITAGADDVVAILAGQSAPVYGANGAVWLLGTGSVQLIGSDYSTNPFKTSAQAGGSGADKVARAAINAHSGNAEIHVTAAEKSAWDGKAELSDIPDKLPADGGNADTLGDYSVSTNGKKGVIAMSSDFGTVDIGQRLDFHSADNQDYAVRVYVSPPDWNSGTNQPRLRLATPDGSTANIADGGNAASVGAYTEAKLAALEARVAALEGK